MANADVVRMLVQSYLAQDATTADEMIADDFTFTSPQDDHIDKATFFERCFPATTQLASHRLLDVVATDGDDVFLRYEYESLQTGHRHRNVEVHTVRAGRVVEIEVYFGGRV
ncbi:MAG: nuclear transport factor 2 family protein [Nocardioidaceae bacterium]